MIRLVVNAKILGPEAWVDDGYGGRMLAPLAKAHVHGYSRGGHSVRGYDRRDEPVADSAAPYGPHESWLAAHDKLLAAATDRLMEGKYAQARGLYGLAANVRWGHDQAFGITDRISSHGDTGVISQAGHKAYYSMWHPKQQHPVQIVNDLMTNQLNKHKRADKVNAFFHHDREYAQADGDRAKVAEWWKKKIAAFEQNEELFEYTKRAIDKWKGGLKVAYNAPNKCDRCGGKGVIDHFKRVNGGECFECGGTGTKEMAETLHKARSLPEGAGLRLLMKAVAGEAIRPDLGSLQRDALGRPSYSQFHVGAYLFRFHKAGPRGLPILTVNGPGLPLPFHMVVRSQADAMKRAPDVASVFAAGGTPMEGMFRKEDDDAVAVRYPGKTPAQA